jgi:hypothetical protein
MGRPSLPRECMKCHCFLGPTDPSAAWVGFYQTVNMGKQRSTKSRRLHFCSRCAVATAFGASPASTHPIEVESYYSLQDLVTSDPAVNEVGLENLRRMVAERRREMKQLSAAAVQEILPPERTLKEAS